MRVLRRTIPARAGKGNGGRGGVRNRAACGGWRCHQSRAILRKLNGVLPALTTRQRNPAKRVGASGGGSCVPGILDSIDWGTSISGTSVSVYFAAAGEAYDGYTSLGWNDYEIGRVMAALGEFAAVSNLSFSITADSAAATFKLVTVDSAAFGVPGVLGQFRPPGEPNAGVGIFSRDGVGWDMNATNGGLEEGGYGYTTLLHEFGHGLGLAHPHDNGGSSVVMDGVTAPFGSYGAFDLNQGVFTIMSYNSGWRLHPQGLSGWTHYGWSGGPGALDVALIQSKYGAKASNTGNDSYTLSTVNGLGTFYQTLYDTGGTDTIVNPGTADSTISLVAATIDYSATGGGGISWVTGVQGGFTIAQGVVIENAAGGSGNDTITGNSVANILSGGKGDDVLDGGAGADQMQGGAGDDTYSVDNSLDQVIETADAGTDTVETTFAYYNLGANLERLIYVGSPSADFRGFGNPLDNYLQGGNGDDYLNGYGGADILAGLGGDDTYLVDSADDLVVEAAGAGNDYIQTLLTAYTLGANVEQLGFFGDETGDETVDFTGTGNALANVISGLQGNDTLDGAGGVDMLLGGAGDDTYRVDHANDQTLEQASEGTDTVQTALTFYILAPHIERLVYTGSPTEDLWFIGNAQDNVLAGGSGDDQLDGLGGADVMQGFAGWDSYFVDNSQDQVIEAAGAETDAVFTTLAAYTLAANVEILAYVGAQSGDFAGTGNALNNLIEARDGDDQLDGGGGADRMIGYLGDDTYRVDGGDEVVEGVDAGTDTVLAALAAYTLGANVERLIYAGTPTAAFQGTGNGIANVIQGGNGDDVLDGAGGPDELTGLLGNDSYVLDQPGETVIEAASGGTDTVYVAMTAYTLAANVENLAYQGGGDFTGTGNGLSNRITGAIGNDTLDGAGGADLLIGGAGNDTYKVDHAEDLTAEEASEGTDTVESVRTIYALLDNVERLLFTGAATDDFIGIGNGLDNFIQGAGGDDTLDGAGGADEMVGGGGLDTYVVDSLADQVVELAGGGTGDRVTTALASYTLPDHVEILVGLSQDGQQLTGNALGNALYGQSGADALDGGLGHDKLVGGDGDDTLDGGTGNDLLDGGAGNDSYSLDSISDVIVETLTTGSSADVASTSVSYVLGVGVRVENLMTSSIAGTSSIDLTGNEYGNTITGNAGANILNGMGGRDRLNGDAGDDNLDGGAGDDTLDGGAGNDRYGIDSAADIIVETGTTGSNADIAKTTVSYVLAPGVSVEMLMTTSSAGKSLIDLTGNEFANTINGNAAVNILMGMAGDDVLRGNAGNDTLDGGSGDDLLDGGAGNDIFMLDSGADVIVETLTTGSTADVAKSSVSYVLAAGVRVETLMTVSTAATDLIDLTGNEFANAVTGNAAANLLLGLGGGDTLKGAAGDDDLQGGGGADKIYGGLGNDLLSGGTSVDRFYFNTAPDIATNLDRIVDFNPADDFIHLARSVFTQIGPVGTLAADAFHVIGAGAADAQDRILYDSATGALFYDPDGTGGAAAVQFATLAAGLALANIDFITF